MGFLLSLFFGFGPMLLFAGFLYWLDRYEKEPKILVGTGFLWGAVFAAGVAFVVNTILGMGLYLFTGSEAATELATGSLVAPPVEEVLKGLAVLLVFLIFRSEFDSVLDGIVYAGITALGFAATENTYYIYTYGYQENGYEGFLWLVFVRVILVGWQHPFYTSFIGIGLAITRLNQQVWVKILAPAAGLGLAIFAHSAHNTLASLLSGFEGLVLGTLVDWIGWFGMFLVILWAIRQVQNRIRQYLKEETENGIISSAQFKTACSAWAQSIARLSALFSGKYKTTARFYQLCGELAHKKYQLEKFGDERGNANLIQHYRNEIGRLSAKAKT
jgi:RsiW-degrading membrane proteinase PrsW (M82 family)